MKKNYLILLIASLYLPCSFGQGVFPGGATCEDAVPITAGEGYETPDDGYHGAPIAETHDHWYSFVAPYDGVLIVQHGDSLQCDKRILSGVCGSLTTVAEATWATTEADYIMSSGETVYIEINDNWDYVTNFDVIFDSTFLDVQGNVYLDLNNNGLKDIDEEGLALTPVVNDSFDIYAVTAFNGHYYHTASDLEEGIYQIAPILPEYWGISSDSSVYNINVNEDFEQRDSLDFGIYPDTHEHELSPSLVGGFPRCNDSILYSINILNTGSTIPSGMVHLELDDSLEFISAAVAPDSIVDQHIYWTYDSLFYFSTDVIELHVGTPDGLADTVMSYLTVNIDSAGVEFFSTTESLEQTITCAYDPNDKTPTPMGEGEFGNIDPDTESIEYLIRFQNTGTDTAFTVIIDDQLDENIDWASIEILAYSHAMTFDMDTDGKVSFIFNDIMLPDSNVNMEGSQGFVKFSIDLKEDLPIGTSIYNTAEIYFDLNPAVITNTTVNTLFLDESGIREFSKADQILIYPNPFSESTTIVFEEDLKDYAVRIVDLLGNEVYRNDQLNGQQLTLNGDQFNAGIYILMLVEKDKNQVKSTAKLVVK